MNSPKNLEVKVAIVGSGPSGFYAADAFLTSGTPFLVDILERLPAPFGLVRYGVAPDHPKIKNVIKIYEKTAGHPQFRFFGNVTVGRDISVEELRKFYDVIVFACGAQTDKRLGIPGEDLAGSYTATEFVGWYNGHPDFCNRKFDLSHERAVIIGQGNVAMDVARILCKTVDELKTTDITQYALDALAQSKVKEVHMIGRRGPVQAAFTPVEIKEFEEFTECDTIIDPKYFEINEASKAELNDPHNAVRKKNWEILQRLAAHPTGKEKKFFLHFLKSPLELKGNSRLEALTLEKNQLSGEPNNQSAQGTGEKENLPCGILFRSVGYRGVPIAGVPFDDKKGIMPNSEGRVLDNGKPMPGVYATGWIKRGPTGVIGTNKADSDATVANVIKDLPQLTASANSDRQAILNFLKQKNIRVVSYADWKKIDQAEIDRGKPLGKPREKFVTSEEMLKSLG